MKNPLPCGCAIKGKPEIIGQGEYLVHTDMHIEFCPMHAAAPAMYEALEAVEWVGDVEKYCPWCESGWLEPHSSNCQRQQALAATPQPTELVIRGHYHKYNE